MLGRVVNVTVDMLSVLPSQSLQGCTSTDSHPLWILFATRLRAILDPTFSGDLVEQCHHNFIAARVRRRGVCSKSRAGLCIVFLVFFGDPCDCMSLPGLTGGASFLSSRTQWREHESPLITTYNSLCVQLSLTLANTQVHA